MRIALLLTGVGFAVLSCGGSSAAPGDAGPDEASSSTSTATTVARDRTDRAGVTRRSDGTFVAGVERVLLLEADEGAIPAFAVDCLTYEERPIEPFTVYGGDGEVDVADTVGGRRFTFLGDAEGNADLVNESGLRVNGDDYAGSHAIDAAGDRVLYGDYGIGASPHLTLHLVARTTEDGALLWRREMESWALFGAWTSSAAVVALGNDDVDPSEVSTVAIAVLDPRDGSVVERRSTTLPLLHLS